ALAEWPDGNDSELLPSGRWRDATNFVPCTNICVSTCARTRSPPSDAARAFPVARPMANVASPAPACTYKLPPQLPMLAARDDSRSLVSSTLALSTGLTAKAAIVNTPRIFAVSVEKKLVTSRPIDRNNDGVAGGAWNGFVSAPARSGDVAGAATTAGETSKIDGAVVCADAVAALDAKTRPRTTTDDNFIGKPSL